MSNALTIQRFIAGGLAVAALFLSPTRLVATDKVYVRLYVDEEEPAVERRWKERIRNRLQSASKIMERASGLRFRVSHLGVWTSDDKTTDLSDSLSEFSREVTVGRGEIAVAFTSQYRFQPGRHRLGGTRGPLYTHILIRENNPRTTEIDRLEVLVHELGHFLGAVHSKRANSVMRPVLGDGRARRRSFQIDFDLANARIVRLVAEEFRFLGVRSFTQLTARTKQQLRGHYQELGEELPQDPAWQRCLLSVE